MVKGATLLVFLLLLPIGALAQSGDSARGNLSVAQPRVQISLSPGAVAEGELTFTYQGSTSTTGQLSVVDYRIGPGGSQVQPAGQVDPATAAARWISLDQTALMLQPSRAETVRYQVRVPPSAPPGDHSAMVLLEADQAMRLGVRLTVNVPGEARRQAELVTFSAQRDPLPVLGNPLPLSLPFYQGGAIRLRTQVQNVGNVQFTSGGKIQLTDWLGNHVASLDVPAEQVLPGDTGTFVSQWAAPSVAGLFSARLNLEIGGPPIVAEDRLLLLPWQQILAVVLFALALWLVLGRRVNFSLPGRRTEPVGEPHVQETGEVLKAHLARYNIGEQVTSAPAQGTAAVAETSELQTDRERERFEPEFGLYSHAEPARVPVEAGAPLEDTAEAPDIVQRPEVEQERVEPVETSPLSAVSSAQVAEASGEVTGLDHDADAHEMLRQGQDAARAGDRLQAYRLFVQVVELDPSNEEAWLWRAGTSTEPDEATRCLEWVLEINPDNIRARRGLDELQQRFA